MTQNSYLQHLPTEILHDIFYYLADESAALLLPASETCGRFNDIARPFIISRQLVIDELQWSHTAEIARCFIRSPSSRHLIKSLKIQALVRTKGEGLWPNDVQENDLSCPPMHFTEREKEMLCLDAEELFPQMQHLAEWKDQLRKGIHDAFYALLIVWLKELETLEVVPLLDLEPGILYEKSWVWRLATALTTESPPETVHGLPLRNLRIFGLSSPSTHEATQDTINRATQFTIQNGHFAAPFFYLPSLRTFRGTEDYGIGLDTSVNPACKFPHSTSTVEELYLDAWKYNRLGLHPLIMACKSLRKLYFFANEEDELAWNLHSISDYFIRFHTDTLEELVYTARDCVGGMGGIDLNDPSLEGHRLGKSLTRCKRLRKLELSVRNFGPNYEDVHLPKFLPRSIEQVFIYDASLKQLQGLVEECGEDGTFPRMTCIKHSGDWIDDFQNREEYAEAFPEIQDRCNRAGIELIETELPN